MTAEEYLAKRSAELDSELPGDCVDEAGRVARLLEEEGRSAWIGRLRDVRRSAGAAFFGMLAPQRFAGRGLAIWTTHYVCCEGDLVLDPIAGRPLARDAYSREVFGVALELEPLLDAAATAKALRRGDLEATLREASRR